MTAIWATLAPPAPQVLRPMVKSAKLDAPAKPDKPVPLVKPVPKVFLPRAPRVALAKPAKPAKQETPATRVPMAQSADSAQWLVARAKPAHKAIWDL